MLCCTSATYTSKIHIKTRRTEEEGDGALEAGVEEGDGGVEPQEGGEGNEAGGGQAAEKVDGVARLVFVWRWNGVVDRSNEDGMGGGTINQMAIESHSASPHLLTSRSTASVSNVWMVRYWLMKSTPWSAKSNRARQRPSCRSAEYQQLSPSSPVLIL